MKVLRKASLGSNFAGSYRIRMFLYYLFHFDFIFDFAFIFKNTS